MDRLAKAALNDFRLIFRDNSLKVFLLLPLISLPVIRYGFPYVIGVYGALQDYIDVILMFASVQGAVAFGFVYSMVLVDERDTNVGKVYGVLPISQFWFTAARMVPPYLFAAASTFLVLLIQTFYSLTLAPVIIYSSLAGLISPFMIMFVATTSSNKIEAMTWQKLFNVPLYLPIASFFVPTWASLFFAVFPSYWAYRALDSIFHGGEYGIYVAAGILHSTVLPAVLIKIFTRDHFK